MSGMVILDVAGAVLASISIGVVRIPDVKKSNATVDGADKKTVFFQNQIMLCHTPHQ